MIIDGAGAGVSTLWVHLPTGATREFVGVLREVDLGGDLGVHAGILDPAGELTVLDPRAVVLCEGAIMAHPRQHDPARLAPWVRDWLAAHPEWPRVVTEEAAP